MSAWCRIRGFFDFFGGRFYWFVAVILVFGFIIYGDAVQLVAAALFYGLHEAYEKERAK
jgi:hypothetical protein